MNTLIVAALLAASAAPPPPWRLTAEDRRFLGSLTAFLVDPVGAERVEVPVVGRDVDGVRYVAKGHAWAVLAGKDGKPRYLGTDGHALLTLGNPVRIDFQQECRDLLAGRDFPPPLSHVAWLYRLGHEPLAARLLSRIEDRRKALDQLRRGLAWDAYDAMVHAQLARADAEALAHGERLLRLYPDEARECEQGPAVVTELGRRRKEGTFGRKKSVRPEGFEDWSAERRIAHLIDTLDDADTREGAHFITPSFTTDERVKGLVKIGAAAVPALLDCLEKDARLTRASGYCQGGPRMLRVAPVREAALAALIDIIHVRAILNLPSDDDDKKQAAARIRAYWEKYGKMPLHRRLIAHLTDRGATQEAWREAAFLLSCLSRDHGEETLRRRNPVLALNRPTAAEAMLDAMDRDLAADPQAGGFWFGMDIRKEYLESLVRLGDRRALALLKWRLGRAGAVERRHLAGACFDLGDLAPLAEYASDFESGAVALAGEKGEARELYAAVHLLIRARHPACDKALMAMAKAGHWAHPTARTFVLGDGSSLEDIDFFDRHWPLHPFGVALLAGELNNPARSGASWDIVDGRVERKSGGCTTMYWGKGLLADPANRREGVEEEIRDRAAEMLGWQIAGVPECYPILKDAASRRAVLEELVKVHLGRLRRPTKDEAEALGLSQTENFIPDIRPLRRPATEADVKAGRAVFHLAGKGRPMAFPAGSAIEVKGERGIVVQAETLGGVPVYGVIFRHSIRRVEAGDTKVIRPGR